MYYAGRIRMIRVVQTVLPSEASRVRLGVRFRRFVTGKSVPVSTSRERFNRSCAVADRIKT
jgi:hypothetical protein